MFRPRLLRRFQPSRWRWLLLLATLIFAVQGSVQPLHERMMVQMQMGQMGGATDMADPAPAAIAGMEMAGTEMPGMTVGSAARPAQKPGSRTPGSTDPNTCCASGCCTPLTAGLPPTLALPVRVAVPPEGLPVSVRRARLLALRATARGPPVMDIA